MLKIIEMLQANEITLGELKENHGIGHSITADGKLINLKYSAINSDKTQQIVSECRGLILDADYNLVARGFERFFNVGELTAPKDFDFYNAVVFEKVDGSVITVFYFENEWRMSTSGTVDGTGCVNGADINFKDLWVLGSKKYDLESKMDTSHTYVFELTSRYNKIVTEYDKTDITLLNVWEQPDREISPRMIPTIAAELGVRAPNVFIINSEEDAIQAAADLENLEEGFVCVELDSRNADGAHKRIKIKSPKYVQLHHLKDQAACSVNRMIRTVIDNEHGEVISYFPELSEKFDKISAIYDLFIKEIIHDYIGIKHYLERIKNGEGRVARKEMAAVVLENKLTASWIFELANVKENVTEDYFKEYVVNNEYRKNKVVRRIKELGKFREISD